MKRAACPSMNSVSPYITAEWHGSCRFMVLHSSLALAGVTSTLAPFAGTTKEYYDLLVSASRILHQASPENRVLISGFGAGDPCDQQMPEDLLKMGVADHIDAWNLHAYSVMTQAKRHKQLVHAVKPGMPLWQTEQMWHTIADPAMQAAAPI